MPDNTLQTVNQTVAQQLDPVLPGQDPNSAILYPTESRIEALYFTKNVKGEEVKFDIIPWDKTVITRPPLSSISFKESMFDMCMFGSIIVYDDRNWIDEFKFNGNEKLEIHFRIGKSQTLVKLKFHVYDARRINDESQSIDITQIDERVSMWKIEFVSSDIFLPL
jgi:hypothetical protein